MGLAAHTIRGTDLMQQRGGPIQFPFAMVPGTGKPAQVNVVTMLVQMMVMFSCPLFIIPGALFFGIEW